MKPTPILISTAFDSGNATVIDISDNTVVLKIAFEPFTNGTDRKAHFQWFHFKASNIADKTVTFSIVNAGQSSYPKGWANYRTMASFDGEKWFRMEQTTYSATDGVLKWILPASAHNVCYFAYFVPYSYERHEKLMAFGRASAFSTHVVLGHTLEGRDLDLLKVTEPRGDSAAEGRKAVIWVIARQHPGESMAEWYMEGFLHRLLDPSDPAGRMLRQNVDFFIVPNMNPDGSTRGHLRTNAGGANLNREWGDTAHDDTPNVTYIAPSLERSPEVFHVFNEMKNSGQTPDLFLDVHGDEVIADNFFSGAQGVAHWQSSPRMEALLQLFSAALLHASPDFQVGQGYDSDEPNAANLAIAANSVAQTFNCLSVTLEMPFKDTTATAMAHTGWDDVRSKIFGRDMLTALLDILPVLTVDKEVTATTTGGARLRQAMNAVKEEGYVSWRSPARPAAQ
eukprot:GEMP01026041.1.p1 GENE.GEMP01026041.1~~GEMP01026041.1.p1  ORF type:complete len:452 (+),score=127.81 GEMP01026041.1:77-1432(+)